MVRREAVLCLGEIMYAQKDHFCAIASGLVDVEPLPIRYGVSVDFIAIRFAEFVTVALTCLYPCLMTVLSSVGVSSANAWRNLHPHHPSSPRAQRGPPLP